MTLGQLAERIGATLAGDESVQVTGCAPIEQAGPGEVTFLANVKYAPFLETTRAAAVITDPTTACPGRLAHLMARDPYFAFRGAMVALHGFRVHPALPNGSEAQQGISAQASVHPEASIGERTAVHAFATVERGARVGRGCVLYPGVYVGIGATVGDECVLYPNVVVYDGCVLGDRVILHGGTVIGHDGFGFATHGGRHHKIPQTGIAVIEDDVEMGACCAVERAALGETRVGRGTKFADLISIGHGTKIGEHCLFVSFVGVSGSVEVGNWVALGGQTGVVGHLRIGDGVQAAGKSAITRDVPAGTKVGGVPAIPVDKAKRNALVGMDLYGLAQRVKHLERELASLREDARRRAERDGIGERSRAVRPRSRRAARE